MNGTKYWGSINLTEIKKALDSGIKPYDGKKGKYLDVSVFVSEQPDQFGNSCSVSTYNKEDKQAYYLANLKKSVREPDTQAKTEAKQDGFDF